MTRYLVVLAAVAVFLVVRLGLRRGRRPTATGIAARLRRTGLLGITGMVAGREIRERVRGRVFRVVTIILLAVVGAAVVIPTLHTSSPSHLSVGVVSGSPGLDSELHQLAKAAGTNADLIAQPDQAAARTALSAGRLDVVVGSGDTIVVQNPITDTDTSSEARFVRSLSATLGAQRAFAQAGLTPAQVATVEGARPVEVQSVHPGKKERTSAEATALLGVILIFVILSQYLTWTLMGVMEEKASRVVEVLLATIRPIQLLGGKVAGIGVVALVQATALVVFALVVAKAVGSSLIQGAAPTVMLATLVWLILGYAFYSWVYAAAGSMAERQDQVQSMALPLSAPLVFGYIVSLIGVSSGSPSLLVKVLAYLPPTAPFAMPTLVGFQAVTWLQFCCSVMISIVCTVGVAVVASRVYRTAVLRTGARVRLRDLSPARTRVAAR